MKMSPTFFVLCVAMLNVVVCEAFSYGDAFGKPKESSYRGGANIASQNRYYAGAGRLPAGMNLNEVNLQSFCQIDNEANAAINANTPDTLTEMLSNHMDEYIEMPEEASIWHNFREDIASQLSTPEERLNAAVISLVEYYLIKDRSTWKYLDPSLPNRKFVEINGRREVVYNKDSKSKVYGINQGTANDGISQNSPRHLLDDIPRWILCGTPSETQRMVGEALAKNGIFKDAILSIRADKAKEFLKSIGFEDEMIDWFVIDEENNRGSLAPINLSRFKTESPKSKSNDVGATNIANHEIRHVDDSRTGVRGWCKCGANHGKIYHMGQGAFSMDGRNISGGDYSYDLCGRCAKLFKPDRSGDDAKIIDLRIVRKYKKLAGSSIPNYQYRELLKQAENKLLDIPDGGVVIVGACACRAPDPVVFSYAYMEFGKQNFAVCCTCGKEYVSADGSIPCGPTAKREMGLE